MCSLQTPHLIWCAILLSITIVCFAKTDEKIEYKTVDTNNGKIRGIRKTSLIKEVNFYSFKGIPYAKSPTGELRFKAPEPAENWAPTVLDAVEHGNTCVRPNQFGPDKSKQDENCLFLNVYVPADVKCGEKLAVLVFIHGGAFSEGSGNDDHYGADFIIEQNAILVTFNYRLGVFGFISLNSTEYSGNMALKDQQLALKWIHSNIGHFSGDNQRIMVFGESAGGAMAHFHVLSSVSRKYFRNAAVLSGTVENFWSFSEKNDHTDFAHKIAKALDKPKKSYEELVEFLKTVPAENIVGYGSIFPFMKRTSRLMMSPVIERIDAVRPFIIDWPSKIYKQSQIDVDVMFSFCSAESLLFYMKPFEEIYDLGALNENFTLKLPFRHAELDYESPEYKEIAKKIRSFYFKGAKIGENTLKEYIELLSDVNYAYHIHKSVEQHTLKTNAKAFYYRFSVDSKLNVIKQSNQDVNELPGTSHADDLCYIFRCEYIQIVYDEILKNKDDEESKVSLRAIENITKLLTNFAKYGEPMHNGDPVDLPALNGPNYYLDVTNDGIKIAAANKAAKDLWDQIERQIHQINAATAQARREEL